MLATSCIDRVYKKFELPPVSTTGPTFTFARHVFGHALLNHGDMNDFARRYAVNCRPKLIDSTLQQVQLQPRRDDHDDTQSKRREILLLLLHSPVRSEKHIKAPLGTPQEIAVPE